MPANLEKSAVDTWVENVFFQFQSQRKAIPKKMKVKSESESHSVVSDSLWPQGLYSPWNSPGQNTGVGSLFLLQGIFPALGWNPGLPHCRLILYQLSHKGSLRILEWVAYPFSSGSSQLRNWTGVSCIAGRFFTNWAVREAWPSLKCLQITNTGEGVEKREPCYTVGGNVS